VYFQDLARIGERLVVSGGLRYDRWRNFAASTNTTPLATLQTSTVLFPDRGESAFSPQISALYNLTGVVSFYAAASRSFRAPTLNELYRGFRVGNVQTLANENLTAERAANAEAGVRVSRGSSSLRSNLFWTRVDGPVSNITLAVTPALITRQRQNAGRTRSAGVELEGEFRYWKFDVTAGYLFADSTVTSFPVNPVLAGSRVPQVAHHQFTFQTRYSDAHWMIAIQARGSSSQFDDDLNQFRLEPYGQIDLYASRRLSKTLSIYAAIENIFNSRYSTGRSPVRTLSSPINFRIGMRYR
jgi:outer membrane receptor protein involved in Fe transport